MFASLHTRSWYSFQAGASSPEVLAQRAAALGIGALALTDRHGVYGVVPFQEACREVGIKPLIGAEVCVDGADLVLLAASRDGYANLCQLLTYAHFRNRGRPEATFEDLTGCAGDVFCLTATRRGRLWQLIDREHSGAAFEWVKRLEDVFGERLSIEVATYRYTGDRKRIRRLAELSQWSGIPLVASADVHYATPEEYDLYDLQVCIGQGVTIFQRHPERPRNAQACLRSEQELRRRIPIPEAFDRAQEIAEACCVDLLPGYVTPPAADVGSSFSPQEHLRRLCFQGLVERYPSARRAQAATQLRKELDVISDLQLDEYFLVVHEVVEEARRRNIRVEGRGSAANSLAAYVLGITGVDPLEHNLLFERFLHRGRRGAPDIDIDVDTERRHELLNWVEERFTTAHAAMAATVVTYGLRSAIRDVAKALGFDKGLIDEVAEAVPHRRARKAGEYRKEIEGVLSCSKLTDTLIRMIERLDGCPQFLGQHSGGMVLSREELKYFTPIQVSANGVKIVQFDKNAIEKLGLIKFDILGLRMLSAVSETVELIRRHQDPAFDLKSIRFDDVPTFNMIRRSDTVGCFQIESQGQLHLLGRIQPETFGDLIVQIALFRPGPLQSNMVNPYVARRREEVPVVYDHPLLEPILRDTLGVLLFQEHVLMVAHRFAGMDMEEADRFRTLMSKCRDAEEMEGMRGPFVAGAMEKGVGEGVANRVFDQVAAYVGYGFCRSHASAFAKTVFQSCWLKRHHSAAYMAAVMQHMPGFYPLMTLEQEARKFGVAVLPPSINLSSDRYDLERDRRGKLAIRKSLASVAEVSARDAATIVWERTKGSFTSVEDLYMRVALKIEALENLAMSGALDEVAGDSRTALWEVGALHELHGKPGRRPTPDLFDQSILTGDDLPELLALTEQERISWDLLTHGAARNHPMTLVRRLNEHEVRPIDTAYAFGKHVPLRGKGQPVITIAGLAILRQRPPTARGVMFLTLEDETAFIQCIVRPDILEQFDHVFRESAIIIQGTVSVHGNWRGIVVTEARPLGRILGGYEGHPEESGGRDRWIRSLEEYAEARGAEILAVERRFEPGIRG